MRRDTFRYWIVTLTLLVLGYAVHYADRVSAPVYAQSAVARTTSLSAVTTGTGVSANLGGRQGAVVYLTSAGTTSGGVVTIEEADWDPVSASAYAGTWSSITTVNASAFTGGVQSAYHLPGFAYANVRARISSTITGGGTVSAVIVAY